MRVAFALFFAAAAVPLAAQTDREALVECAGKADDAERLACFDRIVAGFSPELRAAAARRDALAAERRAAQAAADAKAAEARRLAAFGSEGLPGGARASGERLEELKAKVSEVLTGRAGFGAVFVLDNGMMWRQADAFSLPPIRPDAEVLLKRGALGGYRMTLLRSGRTFNVVRMR